MAIWNGRDGSQRDITGDVLTCLNCLWLQATLLGEREEETGGTEEDEKDKKSSSGGRKQEKRGRE